DEMVLAARSYGLDEAVLASASKTLTRPFMDTVESLTPSGVIHAKRRTEEVEMAAEAVADAGIEPLMARATVARLRWKESLGLKEHFNGVVPQNYKVGFAALQMNKDLGLTPAMFGFAASMFFVSYFLVEVPSNLALQKVGARRWIARIMITWGLVTACMAFVVGPYSLYAMRFILGAAE